jgi:2'-5' RNA ligase
MPESALIVCVPEAEAVVHDLRRRFDASARLGVPAHITLIYPFMAPASIDESVIQRIEDLASQVPRFEFLLPRVARFPATAYLEPEPAAPFVELIKRVAQEFPQFQPYSGQFATIIPHLTVAHGDAGEAQTAYDMLEEVLSLRGAVRSTCSSLVLMENSSGVWNQLGAFSLAPVTSCAEN